MKIATAQQKEARNESGLSKNDMKTIDKDKTQDPEPTGEKPKLNIKIAQLNSKCRICKIKQIQAGHYYCQGCSYKKGICSMCGKRILNIKMYK